MEKDIFLNPILFSVPLNHFLLEKGITLQLKKKRNTKNKKLDSPLPKGYLWQIWLELTRIQTVKSFH